jgi:hypothetical protein
VSSPSRRSTSRRVALSIRTKRRTSANRHMLSTLRLLRKSAGRKLESFHHTRCEPSGHPLFLMRSHHSLCHCGCHAGLTPPSSTIRCSWLGFGPALGLTPDVGERVDSSSITTRPPPQRGETFVTTIPSCRFPFRYRHPRRRGVRIAQRRQLSQFPYSSDCGHRNLAKTKELR